MATAIGQPTSRMQPRRHSTQLTMLTGSGPKPSCLAGLLQAGTRYAQKTSMGIVLYNGSQSNQPNKIGAVQDHTIPVVNTFLAQLPTDLRSFSLSEAPSMNVSVEALIGILAIVISLPPSALVVWNIIRRRRNSRAGLDQQSIGVGEYSRSPYLDQ